jgi:hypothetical protein
MAAAAGSLGPLIYMGCFCSRIPMMIKKINPETENSVQHLAPKEMKKGREQLVNRRRLHRKSDIVTTLE